MAGRTLRGMLSTADYKDGKALKSGDDPVSTGVIGDRISEPWTLNHDKTGKNKN